MSGGEGGICRAIQKEQGALTPKSGSEGCVKKGARSKGAGMRAASKNKAAHLEGCGNGQVGPRNRNGDIGGRGVGVYYGWRVRVARRREPRPSPPPLPGGRQAGLAAGPRAFFSRWLSFFLGLRSAA
jgi:hypothetical protein